MIHRSVNQKTKNNPTCIKSCVMKPNFLKLVFVAGATTKHVKLVITMIVVFLKAEVFKVAEIFKVIYSAKDKVQG